MGISVMIQQPTVIKYSIESRVVVDKFSKAVNMMATLQNITKLTEANGANKQLQLQPV